MGVSDSLKRAIAFPREQVALAHASGAELAILEHGQPVAKLIYEPMAAKPSGLYGGRGSNYQGQGLKLSKHFSI